MAKFTLRAWETVRLAHHVDYLVEAETLTDAAKLLWTLQNRAQDTGVTVEAPPTVMRLEPPNYPCMVVVLDPGDLDETRLGITVLNDKTGTPVAEILLFDKG